jgi:hypothetical protein
MLEGLTEDEQARLADLLRKLASTVTSTRPFG